jgi:threonine aldolase
MILGSKEFITRLIRVRTMLGGSMRQSGILAAAGIIALESMIDRLAEDHRRAKMLAERIERIPGLQLKFGMPQTNMVFVTLKSDVAMTAAEVAERLKANNVRVGVVAARDFRLVTHYWIEDEGIERAAQAFAKVL